MLSARSEPVWRSSSPLLWYSWTKSWSLIPEMLIRTLSQAPWSPALRLRAATPKSLAALVLDLPTASLVVSRASNDELYHRERRYCRMFQSFLHGFTTSGFLFFRFLWKIKDCWYNVEASVSLSMASSNWSWRWALFSWTPLMWSSNQRIFSYQWSVRRPFL